MAFRRPNPVELCVAGRIRAKRKALGLTQAAVAAKVGGSGSNYNHAEAGRRNFTPSELQDLAILFGCSVGDFFEPPIQPTFPTDRSRLEAECERFNAVHAAGSVIRVWAGAPQDRAEVPVKVGPAGARVIEGPTAVVEVVGTVALAHVVGGRS